MAWDKGFNFRLTSAYVTDGPNETYVLGEAEAYPITRNGVTFGWETGSGVQARDRNSGNDRRLAGINFNDIPTTAEDLRIDLPASGSFVLRLAMGDAAGAQNPKVVLKDNTTVLDTLQTSVGTNEFYDATGVLRTQANWPSQNVSITRTFASTILRVTVGGVAVDYGTIAHLFVSQLATSLTLNISDSNAANWSDTLTNLGYGALLTDNILNLLDSLTTLGYGHLISDNLHNWADSQIVGPGLIFTDDSFNLTDAIQTLITVYLSQASADDLANLADAITALGYGHLLADSINNWLEYLALDRGLLFTDDTNNLADAKTIETGLHAPFVDSINSWLEYLSLGRGLLFTDNTNLLADAAVIDLISATSDLTKSVTDDLNAWLETLALSHGLIFADDLNALADTISLSLGYPVDKSDALSLSDAMNLELIYNLTISDNAFNLNDALNAGYGHILADILVLSDDIYRALGRLQELTDDINNWLDAEAHEFGAAGAQITVTTADDLNNWLDAINKFSAYFANLTDNLNNWTDAIARNYVFRVPAADSLNNWLDSIKLLRIYLMSFSDSLNAWNDAVQIRPIVSMQPSDNLNAWSDSLATFMVSFGIFSDNLKNWNDLIKVNLGYRKILTDDLNNWNDAFNTNYSLLYALAFSDNLNFWTDSLNVFATAVLPSVASNYLRRYINDVDGVEIVPGAPAGSPGTETDLTTYLRRYVNDVKR